MFVHEINHPSNRELSYGFVVISAVWVSESMASIVLVKFVVHASRVQQVPQLAVLCRVGCVGHVSAAKVALYRYLNGGHVC